MKVVEAQPELAVHIAETQLVFEHGAHEVLTPGEVVPPLEDDPAASVQLLFAEHGQRLVREGRVWVDDSARD